MSLFSFSSPEVPLRAVRRSRCFMVGGGEGRLMAATSSAAVAEGARKSGAGVPAQRRKKVHGKVPGQPPAAGGVAGARLAAGGTRRRGEERPGRASEEQAAACREPFPVAPSQPSVADGPAAHLPPCSPLSRPGKLASRRVSALRKSKRAAGLSAGLTDGSQDAALARGSHVWMRVCRAVPCSCWTSASSLQFQDWSFLSASYNSGLPV